MLASSGPVPCLAADAYDHQGVRSLMVPSSFCKRFLPFALFARLIFIFSLLAWAQEPPSRSGRLRLLAGLRGFAILSTATGKRRFIHRLKQAFSTLGPHHVRRVMRFASSGRLPPHCSQSGFSHTYLIGSNKQHSDAMHDLHSAMSKTSNDDSSKTLPHSSSPQ